MVRPVRQIDRMIAGYKEFGKEFFVHGHRGRKPVNALTDDFKTEIALLYINKYFDCTYTASVSYTHLASGFLTSSWSSYPSHVAAE